MGEKSKAAPPPLRVTRGCNYPDPKRKGETVRLEAGDTVPADAPAKVLAALKRRGVTEEA